MGRKVTETRKDIKFKSDLHGKEFDYDATQAEVTSDTHLEDDEGHGDAAIIRQFKYKANPETFRNQPPTRQDLFNAHLKQIEIVLYQDGLKVMPEVSPRLIFNAKGTGYTIIIGAKPMRGHLLTKKPSLLKDLVNHGQKQ